MNTTQQNAFLLLYSTLPADCYDAHVKCVGLKPVLQLTMPFCIKP